MSVKRILIITDALTQPLYHPRVRNLYAYLREQDIQVDWVAEQYKPIPHEFPISVTTIPFYRHTGFLGRIEWVFKNLLSLLFDYKNRFFSRRVLSHAEGQHYDLVFCSTFHTFGLRAAGAVARAHGIPLHVDLRDIAEQCSDNEYSRHHSSPLLRLVSSYYRSVNIRRRNRILRHADAVTTVSPWHVDYVGSLNPAVHLIYNGYDAELFKPHDVRSQHFDIIYTGRWYGPALQDPELLFQALSGISLPHIRLVFFTARQSHEALSQLAHKYNLKQQLVLSDYIPNSQIPQRLNESSIILVLTNRGTHGIMTTKFFEALGVEKPILCVRSDEECLAKVINETKCGLSASDVDEVRDFILRYYHQWQQQGFTHLRAQGCEQFTRRHQAQQFLHIFRSLTFKPQNATLVDICGTLFYSNTTFDFLDHYVHTPRYRRLRRLMRTPLCRYANSIIYRLLRVDLFRVFALRSLCGYTRPQLLAMADEFYTQYLIPRRNAQVWKLIDQLPREQIILVSGTIEPIASVVARHLGTSRYVSTTLRYKNGLCSGRILTDALRAKHRLLSRQFTMPPYDCVITDNPGDISLIRHSQSALIVTYHNLTRWQRLTRRLRHTNIQYITSNDKYRFSR